MSGYFLVFFQKICVVIKFQATEKRREKGEKNVFSFEWPDNLIECQDIFYLFSKVICSD